MFTCDQCRMPSPPRTRMNKITVEKRPRTYYSIIVRHPMVKSEKFLQYERKDQNILDNLAKQDWKVVHENFSKGFETVKEIALCGDCYKKLEEKK